MKVTNTRNYPWLIVLMSSLFLFYKYIVQVSPSVMTNELMLQFQINATGLGSLASIYFYSYLLVQLFLSPLFDKYSPRLLSTAALLLMSISAYGFSKAHNIELAYLFRLLMGAGAGFATVSYLKLTAMYFTKEKYSFVAGFLATASAMGAILGQTPLAYSVTHVGWNNTLFIVSILGIVISALFWLGVNTNNRQLNKTSTTTTSNNSILKTFITLISQKRFFLLMLYSGLAWAPLAVFGGLWGNPFLQTAYHLSNTQAASFITLSWVGLAIGGPLFGWLANVYQNKLTWMFLGLLITSGALCNLLFNPYNSLLLISLSLFLFGLGTGAFMLGFALGRDWVSATIAASFVALINTGDALFGAFTEPLVGKLLDSFWDKKIIHNLHVFNYHTYQIALFILPVYLIAAMLLLYFIKKTIKIQQNRNRPLIIES